MGNVAKILGKVNLGEPRGWNPKDEQFNLPFTIELKENFHIHWQDVRLEMLADDFDKFAEAVTKAHERWVQDGKPKEREQMKRYGWWPGEDDFEFWKDRYEQYTKAGELCHHYRTFPRTEHGKMYFDNRFQIELQVAGWYHLHYKNMRFEIGKKQFQEMAEAMARAAEREQRYGTLFHGLGLLRFYARRAQKLPGWLRRKLR